MPKNKSLTAYKKEKQEQRLKECQRILEIRKEIDAKLNLIFDLKGEIFKNWFLYNQMRADFDTYLMENSKKIEQIYYEIDIMLRNPLVSKFQTTTTRQIIELSTSSLR